MYPTFGVTQCVTFHFSLSISHTSLCQAYFSCNGEALSQSGEHTERDSVDGLGRVRRVLTVLIHREQVSRLPLIPHFCAQSKSLALYRLDYLQLFVLSFSLLYLGEE